MTGDVPSPGQGPGPADESRQAAPAASLAPAGAVAPLAHAAPAAPLALYRRYRPASFAEVKGQDHVTEPLRQALRSGRVNHAYLFSGPRGCGKTSSARILARSLNCEQGPTPDPCGVCASCVALAPAGPGSIDVIEIDAASHGGVDDARDLRERAFYAPVAGRFKIYIIDEAHMVTREGFNALLKLVEEPPSHLKFVFATTEPEKVIATIRSRTHHYPFRLVPPAVLRELLEQILGSEGIAYEPAVLPVVIRAGAGSVRDSLSVLDQLIAGSDESGLTYAKAVALLGYTDDRLLDEVAQAFAARDGAAVFGAIDRVVEAGHDPRRFAADLLDRLRDLIVLAAVPGAVSTGLLDVPADRVDGMRAQADGFGQAELARAAEIISVGLVEMRGATSPRLLLELMCAQVLLPGGGPGDAALLSRLERLERRLESGAAAETPRPRQADPAPASQSAASTGPPSPAPASTGPRDDQPAPAPRRPAATAPPQEPSATSATASQEKASPHTERPAAPPAAPPPGSSGPADADLLRERWPDILEAVRGERKVAWMLLTSATVESLADGVLTIEFPAEGTARGFVSGGHDQLLGEVLRRMLGISPALKGTARSGPGGAAGQGRAAAGNGGAGGHGGTGRAGGSGGGTGWGGESGSGGGTGRGGESGRGGDAGRAGTVGGGGTGQGGGSGRNGGTSGGAGGSARAGEGSGSGVGSGPTGGGGSGWGNGSDGGSGGAAPGGPVGQHGVAGGVGHAGPGGGAPASGGPAANGGRADWDGPPAPEWDDSADWEDPHDEGGQAGYAPGGNGGRPGQGAGPGRPAGPPSGVDLIESELGGRIIGDASG